MLRAVAGQLHREGGLRLGLPSLIQSLREARTIYPSIIFPHSPLPCLRCQTLWVKNCERHGSASPAMMLKRCPTQAALQLQKTNFARCPVPRLSQQDGAKDAFDTMALLSTWPQKVTYTTSGMLQSQAGQRSPKGLTAHTAGLSIQEPACRKKVNSERGSRKWGRWRKEARSLLEDGFCWCQLICYSCNRTKH